MAGAEADEALLRAAVPVERQPQRLPVGGQLEATTRSSAGSDTSSGASRPPWSASVERDAVLVALRDRRARSARSVGDSSSRGNTPSVNCTKWSWTGAVGDPHAARAQQPPAGAANGERERAQRDLDAQRPRSQDQRTRAPVVTLIGTRRSFLQRALDLMHPFTRRSQDVSAFFTNSRGLQGNPCAMNEKSRADMHVHSTASELSKLGIQRSLHLPECATAPEEVYELAKRRGMDFVTITDHDTIDGALTLAHLPDTFISEELTVWFKGEPQAVHVLCYGITPDDHEWLQAHNDDVEACAEYLHEHEITAALAHPFYAVEAPLTRAPPAPPGAAVPDLGDAQRLAGQGAEPAGVRLHRDPRRHRDRRLRRSRRNRHRAHLHRDARGGDAARVPRPHPRRAGRCARRPGQRREVDARRDGARDPLARRRRGAGRPDPGAVLKIVERVMREGDVRQRRRRRRPRPEDALRAAARLARRDGPRASTSAELLELLQDGRAQPPGPVPARAADPRAQARGRGPRGRRDGGGAGEPRSPGGALALFDACVPGDPVRRRRAPSSAARSSS